MRWAGFQTVCPHFAWNGVIQIPCISDLCPCLPGALALQSEHVVFPFAGFWDSGTLHSEDWLVQSFLMPSLGSFSESWLPAFPLPPSPKCERIRGAHCTPTSATNYSPFLWWPVALPFRAGALCCSALFPVPGNILAVVVGAAAPFRIPSERHRKPVALGVYWLIHFLLLSFSVLNFSSLSYRFLYKCNI